MFARDFYVISKC